MANKKRKRTRPLVDVAAAAGIGDDDTAAAIGSQWKKIDVGLLAPSKAAAGSGQVDDDDYDNVVNHYDTPESKTYRMAERDLEANPKEGMGFFLGLEVLDGSQYSVVEEGGFKSIIMKKNGAYPVQEKAKGKMTQAKATSATDTKPAAVLKKTAKKAAPLKEQKPPKKKKQQKKDLESSDADSSDADSSDEMDTAATKSLNSDDDEPEEEEDPAKKQQRLAKKANKKKKLKQKKQAKRKLESEKAKEEEGDAANDDAQIEAIQTAWMTATGGVTIRPEICKSLLAQNFWSPTPIQAASLPASTLGRRNIVGAAPTGSGKTLAYLLPILEHLLTQEETDQNPDRKIQAVILAPTRELALQVQKECNKLLPGKCGSLVGGMSTHKQSRVLRENKPPIIIATPGRLWEMISSREHDHLNDFSQVAFLVIDECDRMTEQGSFPQLHSILDAVEKANPMDEDDSDEDVSDDDDDDDPDRLHSLPGVRGEARVVMLDDNILAMLEQQRTGKAPAPLDEEDDTDSDDGEDDEDSVDDLPAQRPVDRQTFVYSATLTLPPSASYIPSKKNKGKKRLSLKGLEGAIEEILDKARARGQTKLIDLSNSKKQAKFNEKILENQEMSKREKRGLKNELAATAESKFNLPPGLKLQELKCIQMHKDSHLYAYLMTTREGAAGPCLVFCNSIAAVKRVGKTLNLLGLPVRMLHANMQQRARFKSVESLQKGSRAVVVATDVAARGLDIPDVSTVVHYDVARKVDGFVHRAGRTARGMGETAVGSSLSLISPAEEKAHTKILGELNVGFAQVNLDARLLSLAQERANLASKVLIAEDIEGKANRSNQWFVDSAKEAGLEIDDNVLDVGLAGGNQKEQQQLLEAKRSKGLLQRLLSEPMVTQRYGKFLSSNTAAQKAEVAPYVVKEQVKASKKKRRKN